MIRLKNVLKYSSFYYPVCVNQGTFVKEPKVEQPEMEKVTSVTSVASVKNSQLV